LRPKSSIRPRFLQQRLQGRSCATRLTQVAVAERAGVRQSHLTYYFPTRDALLEAVTAEAVGAMACEVRGAVAESGDDGDRWLERLAVSVAELEHMRMFVAMIVEADGDASIRALIVAATRRMEAVAAEAIGGADAAQRARLVSRQYGAPVCTTSSCAPKTTAPTSSVRMCPG
jgi:AcrR family transcriptional regulator